MFLFFFCFFFCSDVPYSKCHKQKWWVLFFTRMACAHAITHIKWRRLGIYFTSNILIVAKEEGIAKLLMLWKIDVIDLFFSVEIIMQISVSKLCAVKRVTQILPSLSFVHLSKTTTTTKKKKKKKERERKNNRKQNQ